MIKELIRLSECVIENDENLIDSVNEKFLNISTYFNNIIKYSTDIRLLSSAFKMNNLKKYYELKKNYELEIKSSYKMMFDSIGEINKLCDNYNIPRVFVELELPEYLINKYRDINVDLGKEFMLTAFDIYERNKKSEKLKKFSPSISQRKVTETTSNIRSTKSRK